MLLSHELCNSADILDVFGHSPGPDKSYSPYDSYSELVEHLTSVTPEIDRRIQEALRSESGKLLVGQSLIRWVARVLPGVRNP